MVYFRFLINNILLHYLRLFKFSFCLSTHTQLEPPNVTTHKSPQLTAERSWASEVRTFCLKWHHLWGTRTNISMYNCRGGGVMTHFSKVAHCWTAFQVKKGLGRQWAEVEPGDIASRLQSHPFRLLPRVLKSPHALWNLIFKTRLNLTLPSFPRWFCTLFIQVIRNRTSANLEDLLFNISACKIKIIIIQSWCIPRN